MKDAISKSEPFAALRASWDYGVPKPYRSEDRVYRLANLWDDPRFQSIELAGDLEPLRTLLYNSHATSADLKRFKLHWKKPRISRRCAPWNDAPWATWEGVFPAFSDHAIRCLDDLLTPHGALLPLAAGGRKYALCLAAIRKDLLDPKRCNIDRSLKLGGKRVAIFKRYAFKPERLADAPIFRLPERPTDLYVTDAFVQRVKECSLVGFNFEVVFPLHPHHDHDALALKAQKRHLSEGLPPRRRLDSGRVVVRFRLDDRNEIPTEREERRIKAWAKRTNKALIDPRSTKPPTAYLFNTAPEVGEMTATFCGPVANDVIAAIRPHFSAACWHGAILIKKLRG